MFFLVPDTIVSAELKLSQTKKYFYVMSDIRFALISFLFMCVMNVQAQQSLNDEQEYNRSKVQAYSIYKRTMSYTSRNDLPDRMPDLDSEDTLKVKFNGLDSTKFSLYVDESFFDSIIADYNSSSFEKMLSRNVGFDSPIEAPDLAKHYKLFSKIYGSIKNQIPIRKEILSFRDDRFVLAFLTYQISFIGAAGELSISLNVTNKEEPSFWSMEFTSYDYNNAPFFLNVANSTLEYIKTKNITALKNEMSKLFFWTYRDKLEKSLGALNCDSARLFRNGLWFWNRKMRGFNDAGRTYAHLVYDMPKENRYLGLEFISEDNKFKLVYLVFIDKKKE